VADGNSVLAIGKEEGKLPGGLRGALGPRNVEKPSRQFEAEIDIHWAKQGHMRGKEQSVIGWRQHKQ